MNKDINNLTHITSSHDDTNQEDSFNLKDGLSTSGNLPSTSLVQEIIVTLLTLLLLSGFLTNSIFLFVFCRQSKLRSFSNRFVLCLCTSHLLQSFLVTPFTLASVISQSWVFGDIWCQITGMISISLTMAIVLFLLIIAIDRNYAVNSPLHYSRTVTKLRTTMLILFIWTISLVSSLPPLFGIGTIKYRSEWYSCTILWTNRDKFTALYSIYLLTLGFLIPFLTMTCIYFSMYRAAKNNSARARRHSISSTCKQSIFGVHRKSSRRRSSCGSQSSLFGEEWKAAKTGVFVIFSFLVCWLPLFSVIFAETFITLDKEISKGVISSAILLSFSACIINPYLYVYRSKSTRSQLKKMLWLCTSSNRSRCSIYAHNRKIFIPPIPSSSFKLPLETTCLSPWPGIAFYDRKPKQQMSCVTSPVDKAIPNCLEQGILNNHLLNAMDLDISMLKRPSSRMMIFKLHSNIKKELNINDSAEGGDSFRNCSQDKTLEVQSTKMALSRTKSMAVFSTLMPQEIISQIGGQRRRSFVMTRYKVSGSDDTTSTSLESQEVADLVPSVNINSDLSGRERKLLYRQWNRSSSEDAGYISRRSSTCSIVSSDSDITDHEKCLEL